MHARSRKTGTTHHVMSIRRMLMSAANRITKCVIPRWPVRFAELNAPYGSGQARSHWGLVRHWVMAGGHGQFQPGRSPPMQASMSATVLGQCAVRTSWPSRVTATSSSMRTPIPRSSFGASL